MRFLLPLLLIGSLWGWTPEEEAAARALAADPGIRERCAGTPAEFAANQRGWMEEGARAFLAGTVSEERKERIIRVYSQISGEIQRGLEWKEPRRKITVPRLDRAPRIDGVPTVEEWSKAYCFKGEYPLGNAEKTPGEPTVWRIGHCGGTLYVSAEFRDPAPVSYNCVNFEKRDEPMYLGDAFELFLRPSRQSRLYYEFLVNPAGKSWGLAHVNDPFGHWIRVAENLAIGKAAAALTSDGFTVEMAIPLGELYGAGGDFSFMMVRTDRDGKEYRRGTPVPLLYEGHNIFGYIEANLGE